MALTGAREPCIIRIGGKMNTRILRGLNVLLWSLVIEFKLVIVGAYIEAVICFLLVNYLYWKTKG